MPKSTIVPATEKLLNKGWTQLPSLFCDARTSMGLGWGVCQGWDVWLFGLACGGAVAGHPGTGPLARWGGQLRAPPPASQSLHGKLLHANVAGTMEKAGLPSAEILGCVSYARLFEESSLYTSPAHNCIPSAVTIFWGRREKSLREWQ